MDDKKKKNRDRLFSRYKTYNSGPAGSAEQWARQAEKVLKPHAGGNLEILGITALPDTLAELKSARRKAMLQVHPDLGGTDEDAAKINRAYDDLAAQIKHRK